MTTEVSTDTDTTQVTKTSTEQLTDVVTEQVTKTITTTIDLTSTMDVTDVDTQDVTANVPATVTVTVTGAAPTTSVGTEYHCAIPGYGQGSYMVASGGAGPSSSWDSCKSFCSVQQNASNLVNILNPPTSANSFKPVKQVPSYLPLKDPRVVSSAFTVTNYKTVVVTNFNTVGVTNRNTIRTTDYDTASETAYNSVVVINVGYVTVNEYDTVVANDVATNTVIPDAVTVTGGDSYVWGS
ncbi:hypothetical protein BFJ65_g12237 [Fusarium oxysporum f. sp. cepae]|uniref:Uncharacterized protein n=1 Tax=Fusarium oxysporum f. sp. cepae TaxID=396571 RepID=A0A3L6N5X9_FUSOX|nr:hypothetical protein BFJ65_g12237 [Fusarium oxysporum f. sp. cepae]